MSTPSIVRAVVTQVTPLRVRVESDTAAMDVTPDNYVGTLAIGDRVLVAIYPRGQVEVLTRLGGPATPSPNLIINGDFRINQRAAVSGASLANGQYFLDRWQNASGGATPYFTWTGDENGGRTVTVGLASPVNTHILTQFIEQRNIPAGVYTLSWTGTATGRVYNAGAAIPSPASSPVTVTLDGTANVRVEFVGAGLTVSNVKVESGTVATPFQTTDYGEELAKCQRYYQRLASTTAYVPLVVGYEHSTTTTTAIVTLPVPLRATPTVAKQNLEWSDRSTYSTPLLSCTYTPGTDLSAIALYLTKAATGAQFRPGVIRVAAAGSGYLSFDAEM